MREGTTLDGSLFGESQPCFGCAPDHPSGFRLSFTREGDAVRTRFTPTEAQQGPPGIMHGGLVMALADEIGAWAIIGLLEQFGFTAEMNGKLHSPVRVGEEVIGVGRIAKPGTRVVSVEVELRQADVLRYTSAMRFVILDEAGAERILGQPLPEAWRRFGRK